MYNGAGIANVASRTTQIGDEPGDTVKMPGWYVCNGRAGSPNLLNKFIRCEAASGNTGGDDNGVASHTHTCQNYNYGTKTTGNNSTTHKHRAYISYTGIGHKHAQWVVHGSSGTVVDTYRSGSTDACYKYWYAYTSEAGGSHRHKVGHNTSSFDDYTNINNTSHTHSLTIGSHSHTINSTGTSGGNMPAYYSLIFIIKMS